MGGHGSGHGSGGKRPGAGRPPGSNGPKLFIVSLRVTAHERDTMKARAAREGGSLSEVIKICTLSGKEAQRDAQLKGRE